MSKEDLFNTNTQYLDECQNIMRIIQAWIFCFVSKCYKICRLTFIFTGFSSTSVYQKCKKVTPPRILKKYEFGKYQKHLTKRT